MKALQWLLTRSFYGKALAVKRVTDNQGKNTPGVDGAIWSIPGVQTQGHRHAAAARISTATAAAGLYPESQRKAETAGNPHDERPRHAGVVSAGAAPVAETTADPNSYGFRPKRSTADAIEQCFNAAGHEEQRPQWVLEGDIRGCFDNISHEWMLHHILTDKEVLQKWLKAGFMENRILFPTEAGTPQGGIISPTLANLTLDGLEHFSNNLPAYGRSMGRCTTQGELRSLCG